MKASVQHLSLRSLTRALWAAALLSLPVTSFRYFPAGEGTYVRPLAFYPIMLLLLVMLFDLLRDGASFPLAGAWTPLIGFLLVALVGSMFGVTFAPVPIRGEDVLGRVLRAWASIIIGMAFFAAAVWMNRNEQDLRFSLKWLFAGFILDVLWSGLQGATFYLHIFPKPLVTRWQRAFSMRELIRTNRISGLAYEPAWLAGQISTLYLPWLFASLLTSHRLTNLKWLEPVLAACSVFLLLATFSRGGLLTVGATVILTSLLVGRSKIRAAWKWFFTGFRGGREMIWRLGLIVLIAAMCGGAFLFVGQKGYISRLWNSRATNVQDFLIQNSAGARAAYIWGAMGAYVEHPWTGVGLGASGFYIYSHLPDWSLTIVPEIARQLSPDNTLYPNPKNLYIRILAETGIIGFFLFIAFQFSMLGDAIMALRQNTGMWRFIGIASIFTWLALVFYNMTQDSLAIPDLWINLGILVGMSTLLARGNNSVEKPA